ncbi:EXLDI protein [Glycomyces paridis]|uniref:EXLDI protein n=1 Tax=Glycomyces paridis TaxID=2126555 RepID=A0A4S8PV49_9ACTN|nr:EXLDI protein [Glycomyces paridis]THV32119.1 EXLDI protein [Glycomyces paridis]
MPNKTIYVADKDLALYDRAQELSGGSLSRAISLALTRYVDAEEGRLEGFEEITVRVGPGTGRKRQRQRFTGVKLGEWIRSDAKTAEVYRVYRARSGKFVIHTEKTPDYVQMTAETGWRKHLGLGEQFFGATTGEAFLEVVDTLDELKAKIPAELYSMVAASAEAPPIQDLDI